MITETMFAMNTLFIVISAAMVMFMAAGFAMLEAGMVRSKSVGTILLKNVAVYAVAGIMFYLAGYNLMFRDVDGGFMGQAGVWIADNGNVAMGEFKKAYADEAFWFFQMAFVATAASIVSGALAERIKTSTFLVFSVILTAVIYPIVGSWVWGGGFLAELGFKDFAGGSVVHALGGFAALTGLIILGPRKGRFDEAGKAMPASSLPLVTLGSFILWFGWFGFNGGSQLAIASAADAMAVGKIVINTNISACAGLCAVMAYYMLRRKNIDFGMALNGALAGLVAITADPYNPSPMLAMMIGTIGAGLMMSASTLLEKLELDDVVGAVPVHLVCGIWGTLALCLSNPDAKIEVQILGLLCVAGFTIWTTLAVWFGLKVTMGLRLPYMHEEVGADHAELGCRAYQFEAPGHAFIIPQPAQDNKQFSPTTKAAKEIQVA